MKKEIEQKLRKMSKLNMNYIAVDSNGAVYEFEEKPKANDHLGMWACGTCAGNYIGHICIDPADWKQTLICLDNKEESNPKKKLVIEIKEFSNGECRYLVKESAGLKDAGFLALDKRAIDRIYYAGSKQELIDSIQEQFKGKGEGELKIGEMCEVSDNEKKWEKNKLLAILPEAQVSRFICEYRNTTCTHWKYARPLNQEIKPTIDGSVYTWEEN